MFKKILFIGNSFTYWKKGLSLYVSKLALAEVPSRRIEAIEITQGGASLKTHWHNNETRNAIATGGYDAVVLQDDIPEINSEDFTFYAKQFISLVRESNAIPFLYMAWAYKRCNWIDDAGIQRAHREVAKEHKVKIAPVGFARELLASERADINLFAPDNEHPSEAACYLNALVVYSTLFNKTPVGLEYNPFPKLIDERDKKDIELKAWESRSFASRNCY